MKALTFILVFLSYTLDAFSQQTQLYNLSSLNPVLISPSTCGHGTYSKIKIHNRTQWVGFDDAPRTTSISGSFNLRKKSGVGGYFVTDKYGIFNRDEVNLAFSHSLKIKTSTLIFGLSAKLVDFSANTYGQTIHEGIDPVYFSNYNYRKISTESDVGITYEKNTFEASFSVQNILGTFNKNNTFIAGKDLLLNRNYNVLIKYDFFISNDLYCYPSFLYSSTFKNPPNVIVSGILNLKQYINTGLSYHYGHSVNFIIGYSHKYFSVFYTYDFITNSLKKTNTGSHEILLSFNIQTLSKDKALYDLKGEKRGQIKNRIE